MSSDINVGLIGKSPIMRNSAERPIQFAGPLSDYGDSRSIETQ
jgi:hypothetical protein